MKQVIVILLSVGLAYLGSVQVTRFLYGRYRSAVRLYRELRLFFRERGKGKFVVTIRIPKKGSSQEENILLAELPIEEEQQEQTPETGMSEETSPFIPEEEDYVLVEVQGESHSLSESITVEELQQMGNVLSCKNAPIEEAAKAAEIPRCSKRLRKRPENVSANCWSALPKTLRKRFSQATSITNDLSRHSIHPLKEKRKYE